MLTFDRRELTLRRFPAGHLLCVVAISATSFVLHLQRCLWNLDTGSLVQSSGFGCWQAVGYLEVTPLLLFLIHSGHTPCFPVH